MQRSANSNYNDSQPIHYRDFVVIGMTIAISVLCFLELLHVFSLHTAITPPFRLDQLVNGNNATFAPFRIAIGIISVQRPAGTPDYVSLEVMSILDTLFVEQKHIQVDKVHVFDGSFNGSQVKYFQYSPNVLVHPMDPQAFKTVEGFAVHRKASLNYLQALRYLVPAYGQRVDAILMLEDDVLFDPHSGQILWNILQEVKQHRLFLVDGYYKGGKQTPGQAVVRYQGDKRCCSQAFLLSPAAAQLAIGHIEQSLNGTAEYQPLDVFLTTALLGEPGFHFFFAGTCWVQHIGVPVMGLGYFHRGCSKMNFDQGINVTEYMLPSLPSRNKLIKKSKLNLRT